MNEPIAYLNGKFVPVSQAAISVFDLGVVAGASATEMIRTFHHEPFQLHEHLLRLERSVGALGIDPRISRVDLDVICRQIVKDNSRLIADQHDLGLIVFVTAGNNLTYLGHAGLSQVKKPTVCVHSFPLPFELWAEKYRTGLHLVTTSIVSVPDNVIDATIKHRNRLHWHLADLEAKQIDHGATAILTDGEGYLTETAAGNLCVVEGSTILTPERNVLHGVSRDIVARLAASEGMGFAYTRVTPEDLSRASEAFITSTPHCMIPVTKFNHQFVGNGTVGPVFERLINAWNELVGLNIVDQMERGAESRRSNETV